MVNELKRIEKIEEKIDRNKIFYNGYRKHMNLQEMKQYVLLEVI